MPSGPGDVLHLIRHGRATTRGDVLEATGLSRVTISQRLDALLAAGMIVEGEHSEATGGRRRRSLAFNTSQSHVLVAAIDTTHTRIAVTDLGGAVLVEDSIDVGSAPAPPRCWTGSSSRWAPSSASGTSNRTTCAGWA